MHHKPATIMHCAQLPLRFDVSTRDVSLIGQYWGQTAIDWPVIRRERPSGSIGADTVNTERCRVDRSLTNGHQPSGTSAIDPPAPCNPLLPDWSVSKGLRCVVLLIPVSETSLQSEQERFLAPRVERATENPKRDRLKQASSVHQCIFYTLFHTTPILWRRLFGICKDLKK